MNRKKGTKLGVPSTEGTGPQIINTPENSTNVTPKNNRKTPEIEYNFSPIFSQYSQDDENVFDVVWDWNLSQIKTKPRKHKRLDFAQSPELTIKRPPSNNQITDFGKLKEELETFRDEVCSSKGNDPLQNRRVSDIEDVFDDSMEDQLLVCSQEIERRIDMKSNDDTKSKPVGGPSDSVTNVVFNSSSIKTNVSNILSKFDDTSEEFANDSFDKILQQVEDHDSNWYSRGQKIIESTYKDTCDITTNIEEIIERNRQDALMKRESKKKQQTPAESDSPIKCSPEEIEQKRLQALAKLKAKRNQKTIETNRLEALKRLESRKKRATQFNNSSFVTKLKS